MQMQAQLRIFAGALALALACSFDDAPGSATEQGSSSSSGDDTGEQTGTSEAVTTTGPEPGVCGDGQIDAGEGCDDGEANADDAACTASCQPAVCGDGLVGPGEGCDDGNTKQDDACSNECAVATCGDGRVQAGVEECDDNNKDDADGCLSTCVLASCGDGFVQIGVEPCDDKNKNNADECLDSCKLATCGDGFVREGVEECDDSDVDDGDGCLVGCVLATCGDGFVNVGVEACDDGNQIDDDSCSNTCAKAATCDDGIENGLETDLDCGGPNCAGCLEDENCDDGEDCASSFCEEHACVTPRHCRDIRDLQQGHPDGAYPVDPDGPGIGNPQVFTYCEMSFNGGGWTAVFNMREKPVGEASAEAMLAAISQTGPIDIVLPSSNSPAILTEGLDLSQFKEALFGWAPSIPGDVTRYGKLTVDTGLGGVCYVDGFCGPGQPVGEFDIVPTGNLRTLSTGKMSESPHVGLGFDDQIIVWGYDRNAQHGSNWGNWDDEGPCCKAGNTPNITEFSWRYVIYLR